ncbi:hypothetical protein COX69_01105 [Candidatus Falkowbacteria bacterium CG_4_10_14_0_2_um_filter_48_10]|uniref:Polymerase/histidinol phosphatase N-terminal domain-containing protein n=1 Tax=Candidatus Falkowbacteria bacterium CG23_combo_of_CG06-09_8_20_14_all_49_15 TaxID=1974572 RepID=A0A2G9ZJS2_9BACT|nr:MAG: hypothetical protein COX22_04415 [Candidatus Falkowbacteria bacterium CG23_combo_of_CG06-09_8_20_14_all_49_15]PJA08915.1 MAG: hypothetical protein COX69_01105 [Candidatus Falkowbacteria bacterium CG_4_10_14_0_2_um_filter_48_10]
MLIDLELHSTYSDGYLPPDQLAKFIAGQGVKVASLTDHNTLRGLPAFRQAADGLGVRTINGVEIYVTLNNRYFNVIWYNFPEVDADMHRLFRGIQVRRRAQARKMLEHLAKSGLTVKTEKILDQFSHYIPINRLIGAVAEESGNGRKIRAATGLENPREEEVIHHYFYLQNKNILSESYVDLRRVCALKKKIGGQIVVNHPAKYHRIRRDFFARLKKIGVDGIEVFSPHHSFNATMHLQQIAREFDFLVTGGSDFHRLEGNGHRLQHAWQYYRLESNLMRGINEIIG